MIELVRWNSGQIWDDILDKLIWNSGQIWDERLTNTRWNCSAKIDHLWQYRALGEGGIPNRNPLHPSRPAFCCFSISQHFLPPEIPPSPSETEEIIYHYFLDLSASLLGVVLVLLTLDMAKSSKTIGILVKTSQELQMLSTVTLDCQVTNVVMNSGSQL